MGVSCVALPVVAVELLSGPAGSASSTGLRPGTPSSGPLCSGDPARTAGAAELAAAQASLAEGAGPAAGVSLPKDPSDTAPPAAGCGSSPPAATPTPHVATTPPSWTHVTHPSPSARYYPSMVYDARDKYVLLFGGAAGAVSFGDTWKLTGGLWTQLFPEQHPTARLGEAMAFDAVDNYTVRFGGQNKRSAQGTTWNFTSGVWTEMSPAHTPGPTDDAGMAFDARDNVIVLLQSSTTSADIGTWTY
jgi:hypothetical protein